VGCQELVNDKKYVRKLTALEEKEGETGGGSGRCRRSATGGQWSGRD